MEAEAPQQQQTAAVAAGGSGDTEAEAEAEMAASHTEEGSRPGGSDKGGEDGEEDEEEEEEEDCTEPLPLAKRRYGVQGLDNRGLVEPYRLPAELQRENRDELIRLVSEEESARTGRAGGEECESESEGEELTEVDWHEPWRLPLGSVCWCRMKGYPFWPAVVDEPVVNDLDIARMRKMGQVFVRFLGWNEKRSHFWTASSEDYLLPWQEGVDKGLMKLKMAKKLKDVQYQKAKREGEAEYRARPPNPPAAPPPWWALHYAGDDVVNAMRPEGCAHSDDEEDDGEEGDDEEEEDDEEDGGRCRTRRDAAADAFEASKSDAQRAAHAAEEAAAEAKAKAKKAEEMASANPREGAMSTRRCRGMVPVKMDGIALDELLKEANRKKRKQSEQEQQEEQASDALVAEERSPRRRRRMSCRRSRSLSQARPWAQLKRKQQGRARRPSHLRSPQARLHTKRPPRRLPKLSPRRCRPRTRRMRLQRWRRRRRTRGIKWKTSSVCSWQEKRASVDRIVAMSRDGKSGWRTTYAGSMPSLQRSLASPRRRPRPLQRWRRLMTLSLRPLQPSARAPPVETGAAAQHHPDQEEAQAQSQG